MYWPVPEKHSTITGKTYHKILFTRSVWYDENNLKRSINYTFITVSTHVYVNNQNQIRKSIQF